MKNSRKTSMVLMALSAICLFSGWDRDTTKEEKLQYLQFNSTRMDVNIKRNLSFFRLGQGYNKRRETAVPSV